MNSPELSDVARTVLKVRAATEMLGLNAQPHAIADAIGASYTDVLRADADLIDAGLIAPVPTEDDTAPTEPIAGDRLPMPQRAVLVAAIGYADIDPDTLATATGIDHDTITDAVGTLIAAGLLEPGLAAGTVTHTEAGWAAADAEIAAGFAPGDDLNLAAFYSMWGLARRHVGADDFASFVGDITLGQETN